jgi:hypothetical protein
MEIVLTPTERNVLMNSRNDNMSYYIWCGILALRGHKLPMFIHECPSHVEGYTYKLKKV